MEKIENIELKVAIGLGGGGCIVEVIEGGPSAKSDADEYGAYLDDFFYEGAKYPVKAGVYIFSGAAYGMPGDDCFPQYRGSFEELNPNPTE